jgi:hypothetical protein
MEPNLWPDTKLMQQYEPKEFPVEILRAQAGFLTQQTDYRLRGLVRSSNLYEGVIYHSFYAYAPYVRPEPFKLFYIKHGMDTWAGVTLVWGDLGDLTDSEFATAHSPDDLRARIKELLSREEILRFIGNLTALSKQAKLDSETAIVTDEESEMD